MPTPTIKTGPDVWVVSARPTISHNKAHKLGLEASAARAFINPRPMIPTGATVTSANLRLYAAGASTGTRNVTVQRIADKWKPGQTTWNDQPTVVGSTVTTAIGTLADADAIDFDVTTHLQAIAAGSTHYGWRIITDATTRHKVYGFDSGYPPELTYTYTMPPDTPTTLVPNHGVVANSQPTVSCDYSDIDTAALAYINVQVNSTSDFTTPDFDSGWVATDVPELDLSTTLFTAITAGSTVYWRVRVEDADGGQSAWSDPYSFSYQPQGTITDSSGSTVSDVTPDVSWSFSGTQVAYQVRIALASDPSVILHDSGKRVSSATAYAIPAGVIDDDSLTYHRVIRIWDSYDREAVPGAPTYAEATADFTIVDGAGSAPTSVTATPDSVTPAIVVGFDIAVAPDTFTIYRDGQVIAALQYPADLFVSGSTYNYTDWTADPRTQHSYQVRAVTTGAQSPKSSAATATSTVGGVWLIDDTRSLWVVFRGTATDDWARGDEFAIYHPQGSADVVKVTSAMGGLAGTFLGEVWDNDGGRTAAAQMVNLYDLLTYPDRVLRLVAGDRNIPALVANLGESVHPLIGSSNDRKRVRFQFWQAGEYDYTPRI